MLLKTALLGAAVTLGSCQSNQGASTLPSVTPQQQETPVISAISPPPSPVGNWQYVDQTNDGTALYIEALTSSGNTRRYWTRIEYSNGLTDLVFTTADCSEGTYFVSWLEKYDGVGRKTASGAPQQAGVEQNSVPGSIGGSAFEVMCR